MLDKDLEDQKVKMKCIISITPPIMPKEAQHQLDERVKAIEEFSGINMDLLGPIKK